MTPSGPPHWTVRFAPQQAGAWQYRLRAQDAGGVTLYPSSGVLTFNVGATSSNLYRRRGFLRVSLSDSRYFEFQEARRLSVSALTTDLTDPHCHRVAKTQRYEQNKMNLMRVWLSTAPNRLAVDIVGLARLSSDGYLPA